MATQLRLNGKSVHVKAEADTTGGIGEPATALIGRAVGNAVFAATGKRLRTMAITAANIAAA